MNHMIWTIDDSLVVRKIIEFSLGRSGYQVKGFVDGVEALRALVSLQHMAAPLPEVIILDITLPRMDGYKVLQVLKERAGLADIPILILSARDGIIDRLKGRLAGAADYMVKPFRTQDLETVITGLLPQRSLVAVKP